jgi:hypothetical protein
MALACDSGSVAAHLLDQVVLDAAARDRADHLAVVADGERGADRARARAPGFGHGDQFTAVAGPEPGGGGFQYFKVDAVHGIAVLGGFMPVGRGKWTMIQKNRRRVL